MIQAVKDILEARGDMQLTKAEWQKLCGSLHRASGSVIDWRTPDEVLDDEPMMDSDLGASHA